MPFRGRFLLNYYKKNKCQPIPFGNGCLLDNLPLIPPDVLLSACLTLTVQR